jgi:hypothetical protein
MNTFDIDKFYVSPYDKMMRKFDAEHEKTRSQIKEIEKHQKIAQLRDAPIEEKSEDKIWSGF